MDSALSPNGERDISSTICHVIETTIVQLHLTLCAQGEGMRGEGDERGRRVEGEGEERKGEGRRGGGGGEWRGRGGGGEWRWRGGGGEGEGRRGGGEGEGEVRGGGEGEGEVRGGWYVTVREGEDLHIYVRTSAVRSMFSGLSALCTSPCWLR